MEYDEVKGSLFKQLGIINLSQETILIVMITLILNYINVSKLKAQLVDVIYDTDYAKTLPDTKQIPLITSILIVYATYIFLLIAYNALQDGITGKNKKATKDRNLKTRAIKSTVFTSTTSSKRHPIGRGRWKYRTNYSNKNRDTSRHSRSTDRNTIKGLYESYLASALVFVASLIRLVNVNTPSEELESDL